MSDSKVVIVTGGTYGIGRDITIGLVERGHHVVAFGLDAPQVTSIAEQSVTTLRAEIKERGLKADVLDADVSDVTAVAGVVEFTQSRYQRIDALVNNAAIGPLGTVLDTDETLFDRILSINLKGPYLCMRFVLPHLINAGGGSIVNIGSGAGWGKPNMAVYAASKGGLFALSAATAYDFFHHRVRVNTVVPGGGGIPTGMTLGRQAAKQEPGIGRCHPGSAAGRPVRGTDVASVVAFLISDEAEAISGTVIDVGCFSHQGGPIERNRVT